MQEGYYIQGTYRFSPAWEALIRYDVLYGDKNDKDGTKFAAMDGLRRPAYSRFAKDLTVGLNWNINPQFSLRAEYHRVNGTGSLPFLKSGSGITNRIGTRCYSWHPIDLII